MTWCENPDPRDITTPHLLPEVVIAVTWKPSFHFLLIHLNGNESLTLYDCCKYRVPEHKWDAVSQTKLTN